MRIVTWRRRAEREQPRRHSTLAVIRVLNAATTSLRLCDSARDLTSFGLRSRSRGARWTRQLCRVAWLQASAHSIRDLRCLTQVFGRLLPCCSGTTPSFVFAPWRLCEKHFRAEKMPQALLRRLVSGCHSHAVAGPGSELFAGDFDVVADVDGEGGVEEVRVE